MSTLKWRNEHQDLLRWHNLKNRSRQLGIPFVITKEEFSIWYSLQAKKCEYCDLMDIGFDDPLFSGKKTLLFTIDRKDKALPYSIENMCFSCWRCNRIKSNFFSHEKFYEIAQKYIKPIWMEMSNGS